MRPAFYFFILFQPRFLFWILILLFFCAAPISARELRVLTYNVRNGRGLDKADADIPRIIGVIASQKPDVVGIQEIDQNTQRSGKRDLMKEMSAALKMRANFAPAVSLQGGKYGIGTLSKIKPLKVYNIPLPGKEEKRTLQVVEFRKFVFFNTHFSLTKESRIESVKIIETERKKFTKPIILTGDFNAKKNSTTIRELQKNWTQISPDAKTFPADKPRIQIDYVFITNAENVVVKEAKVIEATKESDHRPVLVVVDFSVRPKETPVKKSTSKNKASSKK